MEEALRRAASAGTNSGAIPSCVLVVADGSEVASGAGGGLAPWVDAITQAGVRAKGATLYATVLESTCDDGPSAASSVAGSGVARVVIGMCDPRGVSDALQALGEQVEEVTLDVSLERCWDLAAGVLVARELGRPMVVAKFATSIDGRIATRSGESRWITGPEARSRGHELRRESGAILVGTNTVALDDPELTTRIDSDPGARSPIRVVVSSRATLPLQAKIRETRVVPTLLFHSIQSQEDEAALQACGVETIFSPGPDGRVDPLRVLDLLYQRGVTRVLLEGGGGLIGTFADASLIDRVVQFQAPFLIGGDAARSCLGGLGIGPLTDSRRGCRTRATSCGADLEIVTDFLPVLVPVPATDALDGVG
jgi:diaminohydroxyphosphoribosylaminopyrimidine deaminase/5-amino-6-(5-phosphoribosylamino)uracil reductase